MSYYEHQQQKQQEYVARMQKNAIAKMLSAPPKERKPIKQQSSKDKSVKTKLSLLKQDIRLTAIQNNEYFCKGCGEASSLDCSHILSVSLYKHLELVRENIQLLCRKCHRIWESGYIWEKMELLCFMENLEIMEKYDEMAYSKLFNAYTFEKENYFLKII